MKLRMTALGFLGYLRRAGVDMGCFQWGVWSPEPLWGPEASVQRVQAAERGRERALERQPQRRDGLNRAGGGDGHARGVRRQVKFGKSVDIVLANHETATLHVTIELKGLARGKSCTVARVDDHHGNAYTKWVALGRPPWTPSPQNRQR